MPIISKETWDKFTQEEKEKIRRDYQVAIETGNGKVVYELENLFGKENLQPKLTYEDVARELFKDKTTFYLNDIGGIQQIPCGRMYDRYKASVNCTSRRQAEKLLAINKLLNAAKFLNGDWKPDWSDGEQEKYFIGIDNSENKKLIVKKAWFGQYEIVYFRTEELAKQAIQILGENTVRFALTTDF